jgi:hypothetical protein
MSAVISNRILAWREAWQSADPVQVAALYAEDGTHESAKVALAYPDLGRTRLLGHEEIAAYAAKAFARSGRLTFSIVDVIEAECGLAVEYLRMSERDPIPQRVLERMDWTANDKLTTCRVYHF